MEKVTYQGQKGFYDESTGFIPLDGMDKVTYEGQKGYYHEKVGFVPVDLGETKSKTIQEKVRSKAWDVAKGVVETPLALATGAIGGLAGLAGGIGMTAFKGGEEGKKFREYVSDIYSYKPTSESGKGAMGLVSAAMEPLALPRKVATGLGGEQWGNVADVAMLGLLPKVPQIAKSVSKVPYEAGKALFRKTLAPTGTAAETEAMTTTGFRGGYFSTAKGKTKFYKDLGVLKQEANQILAQHKGKTIPMDKILQPLENRIKTLQEVPTELPETHLRALERMKLQITRQWDKTYPDGNIPIEAVQKFKVQLYDRAKNAYGETQVAMTSEARKILARGAREELETIMPEIGVVNRKMKPLLEFEEALDKSIVRVKNEKFSITNTIFNNDYLMGKLAQVFRAVSPKHPLADPKAIKAYLYAKRNVVFDKESHLPESEYISKQLEYKPDIRLGMEDVSGKPSGYTPPLAKPTMKAIGWDRATTPINLGMLDESSVKAIKGVYNNPKFWEQNRDITYLRLRMKDNKPIMVKEWNTLLQRIMMNRMGGEVKPGAVIK